MDYQSLFSSKTGTAVEMPAGPLTPPKYVFSVTYADPNSLSIQWFSEAMQNAVDREGRDLAAYPPTQGHVGMRELICHNLKARRDLDAEVDSTFLTSGAGGAIQSILDLLVDPDDIVLVEEFCYLGTIKMLLQRRAKVVHVPTDDQGMQTDALETISTLSPHTATPTRRPRTHMVCAIPTKILRYFAYLFC